MTKEALRKKYLGLRMQLKEEDVKNVETQLLQMFQQVQFSEANVLMSYFPLFSKREMDMAPFCNFIKKSFPNLLVAYPVTDLNSNTMKAYAVSEKTIFTTNKWGIKEPDTNQPISLEKINIVFLPLLCLDEQGFRVGYGKGFYDKFLRECKTDILKIGFSYFAPEEKIDDVDAWDIPLDIALTPDKVYVFK